MAATYCTAAQVRARLVLITSDVMDDPTVEDFIEDAQAEIDAALGERYTVPFETIPPMVTRICIRLTMADIVGDREHAGDGTSEEVPLSVRLRGQARGMLKDLAEGVTALPGVVQKARILSSTYGTTSAVQRFNLYEEPAEE